MINIKHIMLRVISVSILIFLIIDACPSGKGKNKSTSRDKKVGVFYNYLKLTAYIIFLCIKNCYRMKSNFVDWKMRMKIQKGQKKQSQNCT